MIGAIIASIAGVTVIVTYVVIVNRFLRTDEHYNESDTHAAEGKSPERAASFNSRHAHA